MSVSVIIPVMNRPVSVAEAIRSALEQTMPPLEVIVVDDGSTDDTPDVVRSIAARDPRVRLIVEECNGGAPRARNTGAGQARGEFLAFLDSDDTWMPQKLEKQRDLINSVAETPAVYCDTIYNFVHKNVRKIGREKPVISIDDLLVSNSVGSTSVGFVRKTCFDQVAGFDETLPNCEDWDLWIKLASIAPLRGVSEPLICYTVAPTGKLSRNVEKLVRGHLEMQRRILARAEGHPNFRTVHATTEMKMAEIYVRNVGDFRKALHHGWNAIRISGNPRFVYQLAKLTYLHVARGT